METMIKDDRVDIWQWPGLPGFWLSVVRAVAVNGKRDHVRWEYEIGSFEQPSGYDSVPHWYQGTTRSGLTVQGVRTLYGGSEEFDASATALYVALAIARDAATEVSRQGHQLKAKFIEQDKDIPAELTERDKDIPVHIERRLECGHWLASLRKHLLGDDIPAPRGPIEAADD